MTNPVPWSAYDEKWLRLAMYFDAYAILTLSVVGIGFSLWRAWISMFVCFCGVLFYSIDIRIQRRKFYAMLLNKPRSTTGLTNWIHVRPWQTEICCACGAQVHMATAKWSANPIDASGGRFSIVCDCGVGYFKLKA